LNLPATNLPSMLWTSAGRVRLRACGSTAGGGVIGARVRKNSHKIVEERECERVLHRHIMYARDTLRPSRPAVLEALVDQMKNPHYRPSSEREYGSLGLASNAWAGLKIEGSIKCLASSSLGCTRSSGSCRFHPG
jgi:hypothetical protein